MLRYHEHASHLQGRVRGNWCAAISSFERQVVLIKHLADVLEGQCQVPSSSPVRKLPREASDPPIREFGTLVAMSP